MRKKTKSITTYITVFIILYFLFLIVLYIVPRGFEIPIILLTGFAIIIIGIFYFFVDLNEGKENEIVVKFKMINENLIKIILICLLTITFIIPPISIFEAIIDWNQINFFNFFRAIISLIGCIFLPGACIFKIIFPNSLLENKFNVEPFLLKITLYPLISFLFLGFSTFILDQIGLIREFFTYILFFLIIALFIFDLLIQKRRDNKILELNSTEIKISKYTFLILLVALGIIIIALGINFSAKYLIPGDSWRGISYAGYIGRPDRTVYDKFYTSGIYWGYISFSLSALCGIPYININVMLFPLLYLFITSIYLLMKALLYDLKEMYAVLSTIFVVTFSGLFYVLNSNLGSDSVSWLIFDGLFCFRYKSFAIILLIISMALFVINSKTSKKSDFKLTFKSKEFSILIIGALFLFQSYIIYFIPFIPVISFIVIYCLFSNNKEKNFQFFFIYLLLFTILFIPLDIIMGYFFSFVPSSYLLRFLGLSPLTVNYFFLNGLLIYSILIGFLFLICLIYKIYNKFFSQNSKRYLKFNFKAKILFILPLCIFSIFLVGEIFFNILTDLQQNFFTFYLDKLFLNIGFIGILGIYLSYFCFKKNRQLFYMLLLWFIFLFSLASLLIFIRWFQYPFTPPLEIPSDEYYLMINWFDRIWYYSVIPLSIFSSIGLIKFLNIVKSKRFFINRNENSRIILNLTSTLIILSLSNTIIAGMFWNNVHNYVKDEEAQIMGWVSENLPHDSNILVDRYRLGTRLEDIAFIDAYFIDIEVIEAISDYKFWDVSYNYDSNCEIEFIEELGGRKKVLKFEDRSNSSSPSLEIKFNSSQKNGSFEFLIRTTNCSKIFWLECYFNNSFEEIDCISISTGYDAFYYNDGNGYYKIMNIENDVWYHFEINFECTDGRYKGLNQYHWKAVINGSEYGDYVFMNNGSHIEFINLFSSTIDSNWITYFDGFNFSWAPDFNVEDSFFKYPYIINHLKSKNISHYIYSKEDNNPKREAEKSVNIEKELIPNFYNRTLFQYGDLVVYYAPYFD